MRKSRRQRAAGWRPPEGRWSARDGEAMVAALAASGLTMRAFASKHGLGMHRVSYWRAKIKDGGSKGAGFVAVPVADEPVKSVIASDERRVEVKLHNGRTLTLCGEWDEAAIRAWVGALEATS